MSKHDDLIGVARDAIDDVFGDTSVSMDETRNALMEIAGHVETLYAAVSEDIRRREEESRDGSDR